MSDKSQLEHLREIVAGAEERMLNPACSDQNFAVLGRMRADLLEKIEALDPAAIGKPKTALSEFEEKMRERQSRSSRSGSKRTTG